MVRPYIFAISRFVSILMLCALLPSMALAQMAGSAIKGSVTDAGGVPVAFANIYVSELETGTTTDIGGYFSLRGLRPGIYTMLVSAIGFEREMAQVAVEDKGGIQVDITLREANYRMPQVEVMGMRNQTLRKLSGSAARIDQRELELLAPVSGNEVFRRIPGLHVVDEEGAGLRTNIGIRGLDPDRSRTVLILEDGIPVALNPYGEPEMYFTPSMDRMAGVEVIKGAGQIAYGPRTIGGVINYITPDPPAGEEVNLRIQGGQGGYFSGSLSYGTSFDNTGVFISYHRRQADDMAGAQFELNDLNLKVKQQLSERSSLGIKIGLYQESSNSTYVGLTQSMWDMGGMDYVRIAPDDRLNVNRYSVSATHALRFNAATELKTTFFAYTVSRDWRRQDFSSNPNASNQTGVVWGDASIPGGALFMRNGTGNRNRSFNVAGVESRLNHKYELGGMKSELHAGLRAQYEDALETRVNGSFPTALSGTLVNEEFRSGRALSAFAENRIWLHERFMVSAGLRAEYYTFGREIFRTASTDTLITGGSDVAALIPGIGFNYEVNKQTNVFGGLHRGFAPPRLKDAITSAGVAFELGAELSWNSELGIRTVPLRGLTVEATAFAMDFENQIIPVSESAGGTGAGLINGGRTMHRGLEIGLVVGLGELADLPFRLDFDVNATYVNAFFTGDRVQVVDEIPVSVEGNRTPYAPEYFLSSALTFEMKNGFGLRFTGTYVGDQFTDAMNTIAPTPDGRNGRLDAYFLLDGTARYTIAKWNTSFTLSCKNMLDERVMVSRRPQGIRAGLPRFVTAGVNVRF